MCPDYLAPLANRRGIGLITAVFAIVILSLFGLLIARYTVTTQTSSVEDYLWAQSLYSAESTMRLNILNHDNGGGLGGAVAPAVGQIPTAIITDNFTALGAPAAIRVRATHATGISREVEAKYIL
ncbi:MAG: hypothetical protein V1782_13795 [Pseudomonadota bacterium]